METWTFIRISDFTSLPPAPGSYSVMSGMGQVLGFASGTNHIYSEKERKTENLQQVLQVYARTLTWIRKAPYCPSRQLLVTVRLLQLDESVFIPSQVTFGLHRVLHLSEYNFPVSGDALWLMGDDED